MILRATTGGVTWVRDERSSGDHPLRYLLEQNFPNPFNGTTTIRFSAPHSRSHVTVRVFDLLGREVAILVDDVNVAGQYAVQWNPKDLPSGVYLYRLEAGIHSMTRRLLLLR